MIPVALTIAGSDPGGGAGVQADLKTFHQLGVYGTSAITLITVQNTRRMSRVEMLDVELVREQIDAVLEDLRPGAVKTGALGSRAIIEMVAGLRFECPLVVDPVMLSSHGAALGDLEALRILVPRAALLTPNLFEASALAGMDVASVEQMREAARRIGNSVLVKGGHLANEPVDVLFYDGQFMEFPGTRVKTRHTHGTGCTYSAAITAFLARGLDVPEAVGRAKAFVQDAIATAPGLGGGAGPLNHRAKAGTHSL